jgi:hypothetical protein
MVRATATVFRNGRPREVKIREIVPGDVVDLFAGDMVPADLRIVSCKDLFINQASLTGESFHVEKTAEPVNTQSRSPSDLTNIAFMGSSVISGTALGVVVKTGLETRFGALSKRLALMSVQSSFDKGIRSFTWLMIRVMVVLVLVIFAINAFLKGDIIQSFLFSLSVAVGLTPEMLPMLVAINLSKGAIAMSKKDVIVKRLNATQNFGAMDVLCTDKTGTLTMDHVILEQHCDVALEEDEGVLELADFMMKAFGFRYRTFLATRPEKYLGTEEEWDRATAALRAALEKRNLDYEVDEGGGVFYAPKIDIKLADSLGRVELGQGPTIQVDLNLPKRFGITYVGEDNAEHEVIMVHRTVIGSMERFLGNLIEHFAGAFPMWLAPVQVAVIPITDDQRPYAGEVAVRLRQAGLRVDLEERSEKVGYKIRSATLQKVPYMLIIGKKEVEAGTVALRARLAGDLGGWTLERFIERATEEVATKALPEGMAPLE